MNTKRFILTALAVFAGAGLALAATNEVSALLQKGLFEEEANRNLDAAIQAYQAVVTQTDKDRQFAATAIFRLGECYRKQGKTNEATGQYQRILREFPDQAELARLSREYAASAEIVSPASNHEGAPAFQNPIAAAQAQVDTYTREFAELDGDPKTARIFAQQHFPNPVLTSLMQDAVKTEQELARTKNDLGGQNPDVVRANETLKTIYDQIDAQLVAIKKDVLGKMQQAQATLADLKKHAASPAEQAASPVPQGQPPANAPSQEDVTIKQLQAVLRDSPDLVNANDSLGMTPLNSAVRAGQLQVVKFLLDNKANIETRDASSFTPLLSAAESEHRDMVQLLLDKGADVNAVSYANRDQRFSSWPIHEGYTALHYAAARGNKAIAELLLAHGANVDARDASGRTPLMVSVDKGFKTVAEMLIGHAVDVNATDNNGKSALIVAIETNHRFIIDLLLASKADVNLATKEGLTPLIAAVNAHQPDTVKLLLEHGVDARAKMADDNPSTPRWTAVDAAVVMNDNASLKLLLENHADPNATFDRGDRGNIYERDLKPLILAAEQKHTESAAILLAHGADVNARNARGTTALSRAVDISDQAMAELLLNNKADTEIKYDGGQTELQFAVTGGKREMVELLLAHGANVNAQNDDGQAALHLAAHAGARPMVELLLAHGADVNLKDNQGNTALDLAENPRNTGYAPIPGRPIQMLSPTSPHLGPVSINYQTVFNGNGANAGQEASNSITALLRQHGGLAEADLSTIRITRQGKESASIVFRNGTGAHNHFTMLDFISAVYAPPDWDPFKSFGGPQRHSRFEPPGLRFPDFGRVKIHRLERGGHDRTINVDLKAALTAGDCDKNVPLLWGDVVEIPEADHKVNEHWDGLDQTVRATLKKCLESRVDIVVKGQTARVTLTSDTPVFANSPWSLSQPWHGFSPGGERFGEGASGPSPKSELWSFWLNDVVHQANVILYSSDLTRVKVKRADPQTQKTEEMVFNLENNGTGNDLWLRDGDVIEIPEKH